MESCMPATILMICCGLPGSGKSYWCDTSPLGMSCKHVSRDAYRYLLWDRNINHYFDNEKEVFELFCQDVRLNLINGNNTIADATHLTKASIDKLLKGCGIQKDKAGYYLQLGTKRISIEIAIKVFDIDLNICLKRNADRHGFNHVPDEEILKMNNRKKFLTKEEAKEYGMVFIGPTLWA